jgi:ElaB/YqjD/DUF883 family membrane-anchored ribosome-binding protein
MSNDTVQQIVDELMPIFQATEDVLNEWTEDGNIQFPALLGRIAIKLNWSDKQIRENDPFVRKYVRANKAWYVTRGAHGGIMKAADRQKKEELKLAKFVAKKQMEEALEALAAAAKMNADSLAKSNDSSSKEDDDISGL